MKKLKIHLELILTQLLWQKVPSQVELFSVINFKSVYIDIYFPVSVWNKKAIA